MATAEHGGDDETEANSRWPWWFAPAGFMAAFAMAALAAGLIGGVAIAAGATGHRSDHVVSLLGVLAQDAALVVVAVLLARSVGSVGPASFGLRPTTLRRAIGLVAAAAASFYVATAAWTSLVAPDSEQDTLRVLGTGETVWLLVGTALVVVLVAPLTEELFFRGFFYRALRNRLAVPWAVLVVGALFGAIHYSGPDTLGVLPLLALLGALFCLLYERTGSLWPAIALHALNNAIALGATADKRRGGARGRGDWRCGVGHMRSGPAVAATAGHARPSMMSSSDGSSSSCVRPARLSRQLFHTSQTAKSSTGAR